MLFLRHGAFNMSKIAFLCWEIADFCKYEQDGGHSKPLFSMWATFAAKNYDVSRQSTPVARPYPKPWQAPPPTPVVADIKISNELYKSKIIRIDIYNLDYLFIFIYRYEKVELLIWINQIWL